ncbi:LuxR C-terminal-related transcriptional regulator [Nocardioides pacificus]
MSRRALTRVVLVEDHQLFAESLDVAMTIEGYDVRRIAPPDSSAHAHSLLPAILRAQPRIVLLDLDLGRAGSAIPLIEPLVRAGVAVVVVTGSQDKVRWGECLRHGARIVLSKTAPLNRILATVRLINEGRSVLSHSEREELLRLFHSERQDVQEIRRRLDTLTPRESEILGRLMAGNNVRDIAASSVVSEATVRTQVKSILAKLGVSSQLAAVGIAHRAHWEVPAWRAGA